MFAPFIAMRSALRRLGRARRGSTTVEFALVVFPFFLLTFGLAEIAMIGFAQTSLNYAVSETSRQIRTGQAQLGEITEAQIKAQLCTNLNSFIIMTCDGNMFLDVRRFDSFTNASNGVTSPIQNGQFQTGSFSYSPGASSDIVVVRAFYRWHVMTPLFQPVFSNVSNGERILVSTMMFRNEPF